MSACCRNLAIVAMLVWCAPLATASADSPKNNDAKSAKDEVRRLLPVDEMTRQAADNVSRRYNLNPEQTAFTHDMMTKRVNQFLDEHEDEIWPLIRDVLRHNDPKKPMDPKTAMRLGKAIKPILKEAEEAIVEANSEWGNILSPEQRLLHEHDLKEMSKTFEDMNDRFARWEKGEGEKNPGIFPAERPDVKPVNPAMPPVDKTNIEPVIGPKEEWWDGFVNDFIQKYELDATQIETAQSILKELKNRAMAYRTAHVAEFGELVKRREAAREAGDGTKLNETMAAERKLNEPVAEMFKELKTRLDKIPTTAQRRQYAEAQKEFNWDKRANHEPNVFKSSGTVQSPTRATEAKARRPEKPVEGATPTTVPASGATPKTESPSP